MKIYVAQTGRQYFNTWNLLVFRIYRACFQINEKNMSNPTENETKERNSLFTTREQVVIKRAESSVPWAHSTHLTINCAKLKKPKNTKCWDKTGSNLTRNLFTADDNVNGYNHFPNHCILSLRWSWISLSSGPEAPPNYIIKKKMHVWSRDMCQNTKSRMYYARHWK